MLNVIFFKLAKKQDDINRLRDEILKVELNCQEQLKEKSLLIDQLNNEIVQKNYKVSYK